MKSLTPSISLRIKQTEAFYNLIWSPLTKADKYKISTSVPSVSGIYELYSMDREKKLNLLAVTYAWYGGLRSQIRLSIDPDATTDPKKKENIEKGELYYRYAISNSFSNMQDVVWFLHSVYFPKDIRVEHSQRFERIHLKEQAPDKVYWLD